MGSKAILVLAPSGQGKTTSLRNMDPAQVLLIQATPKELPFERAAEWKPWDKDTKTGNVFETDDAGTILRLMEVTKKPIVVLDDFQYVMANEFMRRHVERGYDKFTEIGFNAWSVLRKAHELAEYKRVYFMWHVEEMEDGRIRAKTIGRMLNEKITVEGMFSMCLLAFLEDEQYYFRTQARSALEPMKMPMGMFEKVIDNDLEMVDKRICEYFKIERNGGQKG